MRRTPKRHPDAATRGRGDTGTQTNPSPPRVTASPILRVSSLVDWFQQNRRNLPWRKYYDPYQVWLSEIMLQQTQVETALPFYERFLERFPDVRSLASASEEQVFELWAGLGYYSRARNLLAAARAIVEKHSGQIPSDFDSLIALPGIGRYTAGAILSIAFNKPYPVVDGNVRRVLSRIYGWTDEKPERIWKAAEELVQSAEPRLVNQALMEVGATVCSFRSPRCLLCPAQSQCVAFRRGLQEKIPAPKKRPDTVHLHLFAVVDHRGDKFLMKQVDGLWEFPVFRDLPPGSLKKIGRCRHTLTHHRIDVSVYAGEIRPAGGYRWIGFDELPVSSLTRKIFSTFTTSLVDRNGRSASGQDHHPLPKLNGRETWITRVRRHR